MNRTGPRRKLKVAIAIMLMAIVVVIVADSRLRWRAHLLFLFATGQIHDVEVRDFIGFLSPDSGQSLARIIETKDAYAVIHIPDSSKAAIDAGGKRYMAQCAVCHSPDGSGSSTAPALTGRPYKHGESDWAIYRTIRYGVAKTAMAPHPMPAPELWELTAYVRSLNAGGSEVVSAPSAQSRLTAVALSYDELRAQTSPADDWMTYSGSYSGARKSALREISNANVHGLGVKWVHQFEGLNGFIETSPIVRAGIMFITLPGGHVMALEADTGKMIWERPWSQNSAETPGQYSSHNRGVAILDDKVFVGTGDAHMISMSAKTGAIIWDRTVADSKGYYISGAPLAYGDMVVTGVGTKGGGRGFIAAYDAATGTERWRFTTIPGPGEPGNNSWAGESWREGGAPTWLTGAYDPVTDKLYWGVGNPKPDYDSASRRGDNLYSNSVVALQGSSGKLLWHFQFTPADDHDWDANQIPMLLDRTIGNSVEKQIVWANRNGFYYVLDRDSGKFITATPFAKQTWTAGLDANGRPKARAAAALDDKGVTIYPGNTGATNWWSPSLDKELDLVFVPTLEQGMVYFPSRPDVAAGESSKASWPTGAGRTLYTSVRALNASDGKLVWEHRQDTRLDDNVAGGLLATAGDIVFGSDRTKFFALDSRTGAQRWNFETGGKINAAPITFRTGGSQYVVIAAGNSLMAFALPAHPRQIARR